MSSSENPSKLVDGVVVIPTDNNSFFRAWLQVMRPIHKLTPKEMDFFAIMLKKRAKIASEIKDSFIIDSLLFKEESKAEMLKEAGITDSHMKIILHNLRKNNVLINKRVNPRYIPDWEEGKPFRLMFIFKNES